MQYFSWDLLIEQLSVLWEVEEEESEEESIEESEGSESEVEVEQDGEEAETGPEHVRRL